MIDEPALFGICAIRFSCINRAHCLPITPWPDISLALVVRSAIPITLKLASSTTFGFIDVSFGPLGVCDHTRFTTALAIRKIISAMIAAGEKRQRKPFIVFLQADGSYDFSEKPTTAG